MVLVVVLLELLTLVLLVVGLDMDLAYESKNLRIVGPLRTLLFGKGGGHK